MHLIEESVQPRREDQKIRQLQRVRAAEFQAIHHRDHQRELAFFDLITDVIRLGAVVAQALPLHARFPGLEVVKLLTKFARAAHRVENPGRDCEVGRDLPEEMDPCCEARRCGQIVVVLK